MRKPTTIKIEGETLTVDYDYDAWDRLNKEFDDIRLRTVTTGKDARGAADLLAIGLIRHHKDAWPSDRVYRASPPLKETLAVIDRALTALVYGTHEAPEDEPTGFAWFIRNLWLRRSAPPKA